MADRAVLTIGSIARAIGAEAGAAASRPIAGITADSREVKAGYAFFAQPGSKVDGRAFIPAAVLAGAQLIVAAGNRPEKLPASIAWLAVADPRRALALAAAHLHPGQPATIVAVTGTAGKTSVAEFTRQIFAALGHRAASLGTLGLIGPEGAEYGSLTTPDPLTLHRRLDELAGKGVTHLAMEASSHGLDQRRLDGVRLSAGAFTNLGRDHLDYHPDMEGYFAAKLRLFEALLPAGAPAIVNLDGDRGAEAAVAGGFAGNRVITVGERGQDITLNAVAAVGFGQRLELASSGREFRVTLPLMGAFQVQNALVAAGFAIALGEEPDKVIAALETLRGVPGRLELAGTYRGAPVFVDYAHKPEALQHALAALRPAVAGRLVVAVGCGGDRDPGKRPIMGRVATEGADVVIITDDNPRSEEPAAIRAAMLAAAPGAIEIGDRAEAIRSGMLMLDHGDALIIAGKGHETGQIIGKETLPFSDHEVVRRVIGEGTPMQVARKSAAAPRVRSAALWKSKELAAALDGVACGKPRDVTSVSIDTRTLEPGALFFAIRGEARDGHEFVAAALEKGASAAVVDRAHAESFGRDAPLFAVDDVLESLGRLGRQRRAEMKGPVVAITGSVGKTSTKEMLRIAFERQGRTHASVASYNNQWGVPLTLARMPRNSQFGVFEIGMNHPFEILPLTAMVRPHVAIVTTVEPVHLAQFRALEGIADAKGEIFAGLEPGGVAIINADNAHAARLSAHAAASPAGRIIRFGAGEGCDIRLRRLHLDPDFSVVTADVFGMPVTYRLGAPGRHLAMNSLAVLGAVHAAGGDLALAALSMQDFTTVEGRGKRAALAIDGATFTLIDESYNANPSSMRAALAVAGTVPRGLRGRRIAVMGDMLELGPEGPALHAGLADAVTLHDIDLVFACGPLMKALWQGLPTERRGAYAENSAALEPAILEAVRSGDIVVVKGSLGSRMGRIVAALKATFPPTGAVEEAS